MEQVVLDFLKNRREEWLGKKIKKDTPVEEVKAYEDEAAERFFVGNWLADAAKRAGQLSLTSHPCGFSHPSARTTKLGKVSSVIANVKPSADGFLRSGNVVVPLDANGNAAAMDVYKFLSLKLANGKTVLQNIEEETSAGQQLLKTCHEDSATVRSNLLKIKQPQKEAITSTRIKQVYFPMGEGQYHLLSVLTPSGILFELKQRLVRLRFSDEAKTAREAHKKNLYSETGYRQIFGLIDIGFGGTKPQNISALNSSILGTATLLLSVPPNMKSRALRIPKRDFFKETIVPSHCKQLFEAFHELIRLDYNNRSIRNGIAAKIREFIDHNVFKVHQLKELLRFEGIAPSSELPEYQKIWISPHDEDYRAQSNDWLNKLVQQLARQFVKCYAINLQSRHIQLGDSEFQFIVDTIDEERDVLR